MSTGYELLPIVSKLVRAGCYIIAVDYYGHGQTNIPHHEVSLYHIADDVKYLMEHLKINKSVIGGWSRGGFIAAAFYDTYPEKVLGLILEDGGSVSTNTYYHKMDSGERTSRLKENAGHVIADSSY